MHAATRGKHEMRIAPGEQDTERARDASLPRRSLDDELKKLYDAPADTAAIHK